MAFSLSVSMSTRVTPVAASAASHAIKAGAGSMQKVALYMTALSWLKKEMKRAGQEWKHQGWQEKGLESQVSNLSCATRGHGGGRGEVQGQDCQARERRNHEQCEARGRATTPAVDPRTEDVVTVPSWGHLFTARAVDDSTNRGAVYVNCSKGKAAYTSEGRQKGAF